MEKDLPKFKRLIKVTLRLRRKVECLYSTFQDFCKGFDFMGLGKLETESEKLTGAFFILSDCGGHGIKLVRIDIGNPFKFYLAAAKYGTYSYSAGPLTNKVKPGENRRYHMIRCGARARLVNLGMASLTRSQRASSCVQPSFPSSLR